MQSSRRWLFWAFVLITEQRNNRPRNTQNMYERKEGTFRVVVSFGEYSTNPNGTHGGGLRHEMILTPDDMWHRGFPDFGRVLGVVDEGDSTFIVAHESFTLEVILYHYENGGFVEKRVWDEK